MYMWGKSLWRWLRRGITEYKKDTGSRARSNCTYQSSIRPGISYFGNPTADFFSFLFPWNLERLNALSRFLTTKVTNWPFVQDPGRSWSIPPALGCCLSLTVGWTHLWAASIRRNTQDHLVHQMNAWHKVSVQASSEYISWVVHQGLCCHFCLVAPDLSWCQWKQWKSNHICEDQRKAVRKLELLRPWGEIENFSAFRYWAFVIEASSGVNSRFVHLPILN